MNVPAAEGIVTCVTRGQDGRGPIRTCVAFTPGQAPSHPLGRGGMGWGLLGAGCWGGGSVHDMPSLSFFKG